MNQLLASPAAMQATQTLDRLAKVIHLEQKLFEITHNDEGERIPYLHFLIQVEEGLETARDKLTKAFAEHVQQALSSDPRLTEKLLDQGGAKPKTPTPST